MIAFDSRRFGVKESTIAILGANRSMLYLSFCLRVTRFFSLNPVKFLRFPPLFGLSYGHSRLNKSKSVISPGILRELRRHRAYSSKKVFSSPLLLSNLKTERTSSLYFSIDHDSRVFFFFLASSRAISSGMIISSLSSVPLSESLVVSLACA